MLGSLLLLLHTINIKLTVNSIVGGEEVLEEAKFHLKENDFE